MKAVSGRTANVLPALFLVWLLTAAAAVAVSVMAVRERRRNQALCAQLSDSEAQRHQVEDSLRQLGDRLRSSLDRSGVVTWTWYPNGDRVFWGGGPVESMFGFSREDVTSYAALRTHVHADDLSGLEKTIAEVLRTRIDYTAEFRVVHPSGEARWLLGRGGVRVEGGEVVEMSGVNVDITEQKLAQGRLEASERRFREMADAVPQVIWTSSASGELEYYNKRWYDLTGLSSDRKLSPEKRRAQIHPDDLPAEVEAWELAVRNGSTYEHELRYWDQSHQEYRWYSARARLLATPDGREAHWYGVATEVHERKLAEARLKESERTLREREEQLATVFREGAIGDFTWEIKEDQVYCHPTIWALYGEAEGTPVVSRPAAWFLARQHPDDQEMVEQAVAAMLRGDGPLHIEFRVIWPDGSIHWLICQASLVLDDRGKPVRTKGLNIDITERKKAEMKLRESEEQFRLLANSIPQVVWIARPDGQVEFFNDQWYATTGFGRGSDAARTAQPMSWQPVVHPNDLPRFAKLWTQSMVSGTEFEIESRNWDCREQKYRWYLSRGLPIRDSDGRIVRWVGTATDIHSQRGARELLEKEVAHRTETLRQTLAEKETLLKEIHHRVKNNLQVISSLLKMQGECLKDDTAIQALEESRQRVHSMALIHERLYSNGQMSKIDFGEYARTLVGELSLSLSRGDIAVEVETVSLSLNIEQAIPCGLILNELVTNAFKYAYPRGNAGAVAVSLRKTNSDRVTMRVADEGVGLPQGFDIGRSETLGLSIVSILARQLGGKLAVETAPARGTSLAIEFPVHDLQ